MNIAEQIAAVEKKRKSQHNMIDIFHNNMIRIIRNRCKHEYIPVDETLVCRHCGGKK